MRLKQSAVLLFAFSYFSRSLCQTSMFVNEALLQAETAIDETALPKSVFSQLLVDDIRAYHPKYPFIEANVRKSVARVSHEIALPNPDDEECPRNYAVLCPRHWLPVGDGVTCIASPDYKGKCGPKVDFTGFTPLQKYFYAKSCGAPWPCDTGCDEDFEQPCPIEWKLEDDGTCTAPSSYHGICVRETDLRNLSPERRRMWGELCSLAWPCKETCSPDLKKDCPSLWTLSTDGNTCIAPFHYLGPCAPVQPITFSKKEFMSKCRVSFDCEVSDLTSSQDEGEDICDRDYDMECPRGWNLIRNPKGSFCRAGSAYEGPCTWRFSFQGYTPKMKKEFATRCEVEWHCKAPISSLFTSEISLKSQPAGQLKHVSNVNTSLTVPSGPYDTIRHVFIDGRLTFETEKRPTPQQQMERSSLISQQQLNRHVELLKKFIDTSGKNVSSEIVQAAKEGLKNLKFEQADAQLRYRFAEKSDNGDKKSTRNSINRSIPKAESEHAEVKKKRANSAQTINEHSERADDSQLEVRKSWKRNRNDTKTSSLGKNIQVVDIQQSDNSKLLPRFERKQKKEEKKKEPGYPDLKDSGLYSQKSLSEKIKLAFTEPQWLMKKMKFPDIARIDVRKIEIADNVAAESDAFSGLGGTENCIRDYSKSCPKGWQTEGETMCLAPPSYTATTVCAAGQPFGLLSDQGKEEAERRCAVKWPCRLCDHDYIRSVCPQGWFYQGNGICRAADWLKRNLKNKKCPTVMNFQYMTPQLRSLWAQNCGHDWPCYQTCERDFAHSCPEGWIKSNDPLGLTNTTLCVPLDKSKYTGSCKIPVEVPDSISKRYEFETDCSVQWPCRSLCPMKFWQKCPFGFTYNEGSCLAPLNSTTEILYKGVCPTQQKFNFFFSDRFKKKYAERCHAPWPCKGECEQDFTGSCPKGWSKSTKKKRTYCKPGMFYKGPCQSTKYDLTGYSLVAKWEFSWKCEVGPNVPLYLTSARWPCGGYLFGYMPLFKNWMKANKRRSEEDTELS